MKKTTVKRTKKKLIAIAGLFGVVLVVLVVFISYSTDPSRFLGKNLVFQLDSIVAQIPLVPKTPRQILARTHQVTNSLISYQTESQFNLGSNEQKIVDIRSSGAVLDWGRPTSQSQTQTMGKILFPKAIDFDFQTNTSGDKLFFKVNKAEGWGGVDLQGLKSWQQVDLGEWEKSLKVDIRAEDEIAKDIKTQIESFLNEEVNTQGFEVKEVSRDGKNHYELVTIVQKDPLTQAILPASPNKEMRLTVVVEKNTYFLHELKLEPVKKSELDLNFTYKIGKHNQSFSLERPKEVRVIKTLPELYFTLKPEAQNDPSSVLTAFGGEAKDLATTLLTIERLTKVILLLPKGI